MTAGSVHHLLTQREIAARTPLVNWTVTCPAPIARNLGEIELAKTAVDDLVVTDDLRLVALGRGALLAIDWTKNGGPAPISREQYDLPCVRDIADEIYRAGRTATADVRTTADRLDDRERLVARGVQEWLAWAYVSGYPTPLWLVGAMPASEIHAFVLGRVGLGPGGLDGPASGERFGYDVVDWIDAIRID
jgi:hypothetical protein